VAGTAVEYLDLFPTLAELALPNGAPLGLEGASFAPLLDNATVVHKPLAFAQYTCAGVVDCMGYTVVSIPRRLRFTEWVAFAPDRAVANFSRTVAPPEMSDHAHDPLENVNVAGAPANAAARAELGAALRAHFGPGAAR
jgi:hypothetical protein